MFIYGSSVAKSVISEGSGLTCKAAHNDALRNAIEQIAGVEIKSKSKIVNFSVNYDIIFSTTDGLISDFRELDKQKKMVIVKLY